MAGAAKLKSMKRLEQTLWKAANKLPSNQELCECKQVVLGLVFRNYISNRFEERWATLEAQLAAEGIKLKRLPSFLEVRDEGTSQNLFWVPELTCDDYSLDIEANAIELVLEQPEMFFKVEAS